MINSRFTLATPTFSRPVMEVLASLGQAPPTRCSASSHARSAVGFTGCFRG